MKKPKKPKPKYRVTIRKASKVKIDPTKIIVFDNN